MSPKKRTIPKVNFIFQPSIFRGHVGLQSTICSILTLRFCCATAFWWHPRNRVLRAVGERVAGNIEAAGSGIKQQAPQCCQDLKKVVWILLICWFAVRVLWINYMLSRVVGKKVLQRTVAWQQVSFLKKPWTFGAWYVEGKSSVNWWAVSLWMFDGQLVLHG